VKQPERRFVFAYAAMMDIDKIVNAQNRGRPTWDNVIVGIEKILP
jgi:hypothetical protein